MLYIYLCSLVAKLPKSVKWSASVEIGHDWSSWPVLDLRQTPEISQNWYSWPNLNLSRNVEAAESVKIGLHRLESVRIGIADTILDLPRNSEAPEIG